MQLSASIVALSYTFQLLLLLIVSEIKTLAFVECEEHTDVLMGVIDGIVTLEVEETCWAAHCTHR